MTNLLNAVCSRLLPVPQARASGLWQILAIVLFLSSFPALADGLSGGDQYRLKRAIAHARDNDWAGFSHMAEQIGDPLARRYLTWRRLLSADEVIGIGPVTAFMQAYPYWPGMGELQAVAERMFDESIGFDARLAFFDQRRPLTKEGKLALAEALLSTERTQEAESLIKKAWIGENFGTSEIRRIRALFGQYLSAEDHVARLDRLLWDKQWTSARRMLPLVNKERQTWAEARIRLQRFQGGVDAAVRAVPPNLRGEAGLMFDRLHWRRRKGLRDGVMEILLNPPQNPVRPQSWWYERSIQIRDRLDHKRFYEAARLAKANRQQSGIANAEAEWLAGWLSLRFLSEPKTALQRFTKLFDQVRSPISQARAAYWAGRAAARAGDNALAKQWYERAAQFGTAFYGQEAARELGRGLGLKIQPITAADLPPAQQELSEIALMLCRIDEGDAAQPFLRHLALEPGMADTAIRTAVVCGRPDTVVELAKFSVRAGVGDPVWSFPVVEDVLDSVEPRLSALALAVARQESHFDAQAQSRAGAQGLMQLMPATARAMARQAGMRLIQSQIRRSARINLQLGTIYLANLLERFDGELMMVAAGYNAGPSRVSQWASRHGDPRHMSRHEQLDWIELIPFSETRNYVMRVLEGVGVYTGLISSQTGIRMALSKPLGPLVPPVYPKPKPR